MASSAVVFFYDLDGGAGFEPTDAWVAQTAREMRESTGWKAWVVPRFCNEIRAQKSPGPYWAVMLTSILRGTPVDTVAARIPNACAALLLVLTVFWLAREVAGERAALFAGFATAGSAAVLYWSHRAASDLGVAALMALSLAALWIGSEKRPPGTRRVRLWMLGYFAAGLAMLYKMPMPLVCVGLPALAYVVLLRRWQILASRWHLAGLGLFLVPWLPWAIAFLCVEPGAALKWEAEFFDRLTGSLPNVEAQKSDWRLYLLYIGCAFVFAAPFSLSIPQALAGVLRRREGVDRRGAAFLLIWFTSLLVFFTVAAGKETRYFLPAMPPLFVLLGIELARFFDPMRDADLRLRRAAAVAVPVLVAAGLLAGGLLYRGYVQKLAAFGMPPWSAWVGPLSIAGAVFTLGSAASAWLFARRREHASFAALVATMFACWLWTWPTLMPVAVSQAPFVDFAAQLRELTPEQRAVVRHIAQPDPRNVWFSDVRTPRLVDQIELIERQHGDRDPAFERRYWAERMIEALASDRLTLFVCGFADYVAFHALAPAELAKEGRTMPRTWVWRAARVGRPDRRYILFGNRPPPDGTAPDVAWLDAFVQQAAERQRAATSPDDGAAPSGRAASRPVSID